MVKKMAVRKTRREMLVEQDKIVKFISKYQKAKASEEGGNPFNYIITRPSELVWDRPSRKKLEASKSVRRGSINDDCNHFRILTQQLFIPQTAPWSVPHHQRRLG